MAANLGIFSRKERIVSMDEAEFQTRYTQFWDWLEMNRPVSDAAILAQCRAVFASTVGANESLEWYVETMMNHAVAMPWGDPTPEAYAHLHAVWVGIRNQVQPAMLRFPSDAPERVTFETTPAPSRRKRYEMKPGYKTTEFWLSTLAVLVGLLIASGMVGDGTAMGKVLALASSTLAQLGYTFARGSVKKAAALPDPAPPALPAAPE